eukprot:5796526-Pyramimonas_sp.AAC.1
MGGAPAPARRPRSRRPALTWPRPIAATPGRAGRRARLRCAAGGGPEGGRSVRRGSGGGQQVIQSIQTRLHIRSGGDQQKRHQVY